MSGTLPEVLSATPLVDHHAHAVLREHPATLDDFRALFSESRDPRQWRHVAATVSYRRAIAELAEHVDCEPTEDAVFERRLATSADDYAASLLRTTGTEWLFLDEGFPPADAAYGTKEMGVLAGCEARPVLRIESLAEAAQADGEDLASLCERVREDVRSARDHGYAALKTIAAYRTGLDIRPPDEAAAAAALRDAESRLGSKPLLELVLWEALAANAHDPLPVQVHCGFGDADLALDRADPALLKTVLEAFPDTPFVLLHCYPYVREAGWLAHVYANVYFDVSLTIPYVARPAEALGEALELAPYSKLLYASDAARAPELYFLAARRWRDALAEVLPELLPPDDAARAGAAILYENAVGLYGLAVNRSSLP